MSLLSTLYNILVLRRIADNPGPFDPGQVKKILVVRTDNIGDVLCSTPAMVSLRKLFPQARLSALVCTHSQDALYQHPVLDELYVYPKAKHRYKGYGRLKSWRILWQTLRRIRKQNYDLAISLRTDFSTSLAWLVYASRARWKVGPMAKGKRRKMGFFYNTPLPWPQNQGHEVQYVLALLRQLGLDAQKEKICLAQPPEAMAEAENFIARNCCGQKPLVLNVGYWPYDSARNWKPANYARLVEELVNANIAVVLTHGPGQEQWLRENILARLARPVPVFFSPHLLNLAALLRYAPLFVTVDGGMVHVAAGAACAVLDLVEAKHADRWYPWNVEQKTIRWQDNVNQVSVHEVLAALRDMPAFQALSNK